jgi:ferredoxin
MPKITFLKTGEVHEVPAGTSFLEFCQANNAPHDFGCTVGSCGTCCLVLEEGAHNIQPLSDEERETIEMCTDEQGARLGCQMVVNGDVKLRPANT